MSTEKQNITFLLTNDDEQYLQIFAEYLAPTKTQNAKQNAKRNRTAERNSGILKCRTKLLKGETELLKGETDFLTREQSVKY